MGICRHPPFFVSWNMVTGAFPHDMTVFLQQLNPGWLAGLISRDRWPADVMAPWHSSTNQGFRSHCSDVSMATNHQPISTPIYGNVQSPILDRDFPVHKTHPAFLGYPHFPSWKAPDVTPRGTTQSHTSSSLHLLVELFPQVHSSAFATYQACESLVNESGWFRRPFVKKTTTIIPSGKHTKITY